MTISQQYIKIHHISCHFVLGAAQGLAPHQLRGGDMAVLQQGVVYK